MMKIILYILFSLFAICRLTAQGISYMPYTAAQYGCWDKHSSLKNDNKRRLGFGESLERRGAYRQSTGLRNNFRDIVLTHFNKSLLTRYTFDPNRWRSERGRCILLPFSVLGSGAHLIGLDTVSTTKSTCVSLGGRAGGPISELNPTCFRKFSNGFRGLRIHIEPSIARMNFHTALPYRDTWMGGVYAGLDFGSNVGFRGFYLKAMNVGKVKLDTDRLALYGGEFRLQPNVAQDITPTLLLGGGYMHVNDQYKPRDLAPARSQLFAQGGLGLHIPVSGQLQILGGVRAILTADSDGRRLQGADVLHANWMYNLGLKLTLCKKIKVKKTLFTARHKE